MNFLNFLNDLIHPKHKVKMRPTIRKTETTQEAAARALDRLFQSSRNGRK